MNRLWDRFLQSRWITSIQLDPFKNPAADFMTDLLKELAELGIEIVDINSSARGIKQDSLQMASGIEKMGLTTIPHVTPRDSLTEAVLSQILGAYTWGNVRNVLIIRGDPREGTNVYETDSPELIQKLKELRDERGLDLKIGCAFAQTYKEPAEIKREEKRLSAKLGAGADFVMTQPIFYYPEWERELKYLQQAISVPFLIGLWPLFDEGTLDKILEGKITGVVLPQYTRESLKKNFTRAPSIQKEWFYEMLRTMQKEGVAGVYIITPFRKELGPEFIKFLSSLKEEGIVL